MKVAVIGAAGQMGRWLLNHFEEQGYTLVASDSRNDELRDLAETSELILASSNAAAVKDADVVVISVPIANTAEVIQDIALHMKNNAVLCEISSVKGDLPKILQKVSESGIRPLCIHPMFGPGARSLRKKIALIPIVDLEAEDHLVETLFPNCDMVIADAEEHDRIVALTVSLPYFVNMVLTSVLADEDISLLERLGGTTFTVQLMLSGSIMSQPSTLHASLHSGNKYVPALLQKLQLKTKESIASLVDNDTVRFEQFFSEVKESFAVGVDLEEKYDEMYKLLEIMGSENEVEVSD
jgi:prephenate dehydrogenase